MARSLPLLAAAALVAGCGSAGRTVVHQRFESVQAPHYVAATTVSARQRVGTDCKLSAVYKVQEATGTAYLIQTELVHLRLRPPRAGTRYRLDCRGPLVIELPVGAVHLDATSGKQTLSVHRLHTVRLGPGRPIRPQPRTQLVAVDWPDATAATYDDRKLEARPVADASGAERGTDWTVTRIPVEQGDDVVLRHGDNGHDEVVIRRPRAE